MPIWINVDLLQCPVNHYARDQGLQVYHWPIPAVENLYDVGVVVSFGHLIPQKVISMFP